MPGTYGQLPLPLDWRVHPRFERFHAGSGNEVLEAVRALAEGAPGAYRQVYLWGAAGTGKTHLLLATCGHVAGRGDMPGYLPLGRRELAPAALHGLELAATTVCIDDVHRWAGDRAREEALFHLFNRCEARGSAMLFASRRPPSPEAFELPDLGSRLRSCLVLHLRPLDEEGCRSVLRAGAHDRGFELGDGVATWLLRRMPRDMHSLTAALDSLDRHSLASKRRVTLAMVRTLFDSGAAPEG